MIKWGEKLCEDHKVLCLVMWSLIIIELYDHALDVVDFCSTLSYVFMILYFIFSSSSVYRHYLIVILFYLFFSGSSY